METDSDRPSFWGVISGGAFYALAAIAVYNILDQMDIGSVITPVGMLGALSIAYFYPSYVAIKYKCPNVTAVVLVNLLMGWLFGIGWLVALLWVARMVGNTAVCEYCAEPVSKHAMVCKHCGREFAVESVD